MFGYVKVVELRSYKTTLSNIWFEEVNICWFHHMRDI